MCSRFPLTSISLKAAGTVRNDAALRSASRTPLQCVLAIAPRNVHRQKQGDALEKPDGDANKQRRL
jgi:hypothetical protein